MKLSLCSVLRPLAGGVIAAVALLLATVPASGQVNTEKLRKGAAQEGLSGSFRLSLAFREGNSDTFALGTGFRIARASIAPIPNPQPEEVAEEESVAENAEAPKVPAEAELTATEVEGEAEELSFNPRLIFLVTELDFEEANDRRTVNDFFAHLRWTEMRSPRFGFEGFLQAQTNQFQRLDRRLLAGGGVRFGLLRSADAEVFLGTGYMLEHERLDPLSGAGSTRPEETDHHRWTSYLNLKLELFEERLLISTTTYVQPRFDEFSDLRLLHETDLAIPLTEHLRLGFSISLSHDSEPPEGVKDTDVSLKNRFSYTF